MRRAQIVRWAAEIFDKSGFEGASLVEIVEAAGMTKGASYCHFRSRRIWPGTSSPSSTGSPSLRCR
ncbi:transcriptional regulator, TetR family [Rhodococcus wratislaviensis]|uniref:Transcriptional regulator, TetR family n=1 Tax=Rhodococcus wratislaviensis TaxID=44752 RepID=A0A402C4B8_RHOWR|nr:transcriptional regulator, TetR family [Rhodococcus wratislaviensis]